MVMKFLFIIEVPTGVLPGVMSANRAGDSTQRQGGNTLCIGTPMAWATVNLSVRTINRTSVS